jgi:hypothetical protein
MSGDAGARAPAQDEPRDLIRASIRARAVAASTVWRVPACNSSIAARRSSRRPGVASRSASASAETQSSSGIECTTGLSVALRLSRRTTEIARPGRIGARLRDDAGRLSRLSRNWSRARSCPHSVGSIGFESGIQAPLGSHSGPGLGLDTPPQELCDGHTLIVVDAARRRPGRGRLRTLWCSRCSLPSLSRSPSSRMSSSTSGPYRRASHRDGRGQAGGG